MVRTIVCDLDGSLMNPSSGIYVNEAVKEALIEVEKKDAALQYVGSWNQHFYRVKKGLLFEVNIGHTLCA